MTLRISFFGGYRVSQGAAGEGFTSQRKVMGLLAFLALEAAQVHSREFLMGLFWPELPEADARNNLRVSLARLRKSLDEGLATESPLIASRTDVGFRLSTAVAMDVASFESLLAQTEAHAHAGRPDCPTCREKLAAAAALYRGPLLQGFYLDDCPAFEEWLFVRRERLLLQAMEVLEDLAQGLEKNGRYPEATTYTRRQLEQDALYDSAQSRLLRLLAYQDQHNVALQQYQVFRTTLRNELGIEPSVELIQLAQQIQDRSLPAPGAARAPESAIHRHNLPENLTPFFGRESELAELAQRLAQPDYRLITLVGPGGAGKTRLSLEAARANLHRFPDGTFFISLAGVERVENVPAAVADVLGLLGATSQAPEEQLIQYLLARKMLLIVDNLEHLMDAVDVLLAILRRCPGIVLLVTSRQRLDVQAEDLFRLRGLPVPVPVPEQIEQAGSFDAVRLFCDRAHRVEKSFKLTVDNRGDVSAICRLVEGLPLALELAASWIRDLSPAELAQVIAENVDRLRTTMRDVAPQHRSIRAVFDYSWRLLTAEEQLLLARLSVFRGGFTQEAANLVAAATPTGLTGLRYRSLIRQSGSTRFDMHELTRQFAAEELLEMGKNVATHGFRQHADTFTNLVATQVEALHGRHPQEAVKIIQQDLDNVRQAWLWAVGDGIWPAIRASVIGLSRFYQAVGLLAEGEQMIGQALVAGRAEDDAALARELSLQIDLLLEQTRLFIQQGKLGDALLQAETAVNLAQELGDSVRRGRGLMLLGNAHAKNGALRKSVQYLEASLTEARRGQDLALEGETLRYLGTTIQSMEERVQGNLYMQQALAISREVGDRIQEQAILLYMGVNEIEAQNYLAGRQYLEEALPMLQATGNRPLESRIQNALGFVNAALGQLEKALSYHERSRHISHDIGDLLQESHACHNLCTVSRKLGRLEAAEQHGREALRLALHFDLAEPIAYAWLHLGYVFHDQGDFKSAAEAFIQSRDIWRTHERWGLMIEATAGLAISLWQQRETAAALSQVEEVLDFLADQPLQGVDEPTQIYLNCYRVLHGNGEGRADALLRQAYDRLQVVADKIDDSALRTAFWQNIPAHRALLQWYTQTINKGNVSL
ncbi:MAG: tetratricopeptide repeat protein [Chloroflexi bacterium]|nr:tetratricopeptide repeat protein [Chloroflexota bacterium]